jgi:hypothetical protein
MRSGHAGRTWGLRRAARDALGPVTRRAPRVSHFRQSTSHGLAIILHHLDPYRAAHSQGSGRPLSHSSIALPL